MNRSIVIAAIITVGAAAWVLSGELGSGAAGNTETAAAPADAAASAPPKPLNLVQVTTFVAEPRLSEIVLRGRTEASRWVDVKAETVGRVTAIRADKGAAVKTGQILLELSIDDREIKLAEATALVRQRKMEHDASAQLSEKGYRAPTKVAEAAALLDQAMARKAAIELDITKTRIRAPFDGVVEHRHVQIGDYLTDAKAVARVVDQDPYLVIGQVSERDILALKVGDPGRARLADGQWVTGKIRFLATTAEEKTRTFRVELEVPNPNRTLRDGLTAEIRIANQRQLAHRLTPAVLTLNDAGVLGVRMVDDNNVVRFQAVQILDDTKDGIWLTGLPERVTIITVGQEFVREGETVRVAATADGRAS